MKVLRVYLEQIMLNGRLKVKNMITGEEIETELVAKAIKEIIK